MQCKVWYFIVDNFGSWKVVVYVLVLWKKFDFEESEKLVCVLCGFDVDFEFIDDFKYCNWVFWCVLDDVIMIGLCLCQIFVVDLVMLVLFVDYLCVVLDLEF